MEGTCWRLDGLLCNQPGLQHSLKMFCVFRCLLSCSCHVHCYCTQSCERVVVNDLSIEEKYDPTLWINFLSSLFRWGAWVFAFCILYFLSIFWWSVGKVMLWMFRFWVEKLLEGFGNISHPSIKIAFVFCCNPSLV